MSCLMLRGQKWVFLAIERNYICLFLHLVGFINVKYNEQNSTVKSFDSRWADRRNTARHFNGSRRWWWRPAVFCCIEFIDSSWKWGPSLKSSLPITRRPRNPSSSCYLSYFKFSLKTRCVLYWWLLMWARPSCTSLSAVWRYFWFVKILSVQDVYSFFSINDWLICLTTLI